MPGKASGSRNARKSEDSTLADQSRQSIVSDSDIPYQQAAFGTSESKIEKMAHSVEHRIRLALILSPCQPCVGILLVTKAGFMVTSMRLECSPFKYIGVFRNFLLCLISINISGLFLSSLI